VVEKKKDSFSLFAPLTAICQRESSAKEKIGQSAIIPSIHTIKIGQCKLSKNTETPKILICDGNCKKR